VEAANHGHPYGFQVAVTVVLEQLKREQLKKQRKDLNHTFTSYTRPSAFHLLVVLIARVFRCKPARSICNVVSC
jgi:hypothetical protein